MIDYSEQIKSLVKITDVVKQNGIKIERQNFIKCPFHSEKTASLKLFPDNTFYCFGCGAGGDVLEFAKKLYNIDFNQAIFRLDYDFQLNLPIGRQPTILEKQVIASQNKAIQERTRQEEEQVNTLRDNYYRALDRLLSLEYIIKNYRPSNDEEMTQQFIFAIKNIDFARYECDRAELERRAYDGRRSSNSAV